MAINPFVLYPTQMTPPDTDFPVFGSAKDVSSPGGGDGTPWIKPIIDDQFGFQQAILTESNITPSGNSETALASDYLDGLKKIGRNETASDSEFGTVKKSPLPAFYSGINQGLSQTFTNSGSIDVAWNNPYSNANFDGVIYTIPKAGFYDVQYSVNLNANSFTGQFNAFILQNGNICGQDKTQWSAFYFPICHGVTTLYCEIGDEIKITFL